jgi:potassium efflux system protein
MTSSAARFRRALLAAALGLWPLCPAAAQTGAPPPPVAAPTGPPAAPAPPKVSAETKALRAQLDSTKIQLDQETATLRRANLSSAELQDLRQRVEPLAERLRGIAATLSPRLEDAKARLAQLGPKPAGSDESADVARDRAEREGAVAEYDETLRLASALALEAEQITTQLSDRRRSNFTRALFERSSGVLGAGLWRQAAQNLPRDLMAMRTVAMDVADRVRRDANLPTLTMMALALGAALALHVGRRRIVPRLIRREPAEGEVPRRRLLRSALAVLLVETLPALAGALLLYGAMEVSGLFPARVQPTLTAVLTGITFVAFVRALAEAILAPERPAWRLVKLGETAAGRTFAFAVTFATVLAAGKVVEAAFQTIAAGLPLTVLTRQTFAVAEALILAELLRRFATAETIEEECLGPYVPSEPEVGGPIRIVGWILTGAVLLAALGGYVAFASFLVDQLVWIAILLSLLLLAIALADEFIGGTLTGSTRIATALQANTGLRRRQVEQIGVLLNGVARVVLILVAALLALAPWGVESVDLVSSVRAAIFGFKVGDVTVSLSTLVFAILIFGIGFIATRIVQRWLEMTFLPTTELDAGLRNSISTAFGYVGFFAAASFAFSYLGLGLDKIAIVAGALSVGIGFGLQSIVNNFVSGLILLWERPIRVGDLVVVGDGEGHVRRISVRATEIETFDRSTVIVPNSNLISGVVRNRVRSDRSGRVVIPVGVPHNQDPSRVAQLLLSCGQGHADVLAEPAPKVFFKKIGDASLDLELVCVVADVNFQGKVQSELNFSVFKCLVDEGVLPPPGPGATTVLGLEPVQTALDHIAAAIAREPARGQDAPPPREDVKPA